MNKKLSEDYRQDLADILQFCTDNDTDRCEIEVELDGKTLVVQYIFSIKQNE